MNIGTYAALLATLGCGEPATTDVEPAAVVIAMSAARGAHGRTVDLITLTEDGSTALTIDPHGSMRLWPTLDGSREPIALEGVPARALAIVHAGTTNFTAMLDHASHVTIAQWGEAGEPRGRAQLEHPAIALYASRGSFLTIGDDRVVHIYAPTGVLRSTLRPDPGQRVESLAIRDGHVLAMITDLAGTHGRWIETATGAWGAVTPAYDKLRPTDVVLSPGASFLSGVDDTHHIKTYEVATGAASPTQVCSGESNPSVAQTKPIGFASRSILACLVLGAVQWWELDGTAIEVTARGPRDPRRVVRSPTGALVTANLGELEISTPTASRYLGYRTPQFPHVRFEPNHVLVGNGDQKVRVLDHDLQVSAPVSLPDVPGQWFDLAAIDHDAVLALLEDVHDGEPRTRVVVVDSKLGLVGLGVETTPRTRRLDFDGSQRALVVDHASGRTIHRLDPRTRTLDRQCGWDFGLWPTPTPTSLLGSAADLVCDVAR